MAVMHVNETANTQTWSSDDVDCDDVDSVSLRVVLRRCWSATGDTSFDAVYID